MKNNVVLHRKGPVVRAEIDTELFAQFSAQADAAVPVIELPVQKNEQISTADAQTTIELAKLRTQIKKLEKQLSVRDDEKKTAITNQFTTTVT